MASEFTARSRQAWPRSLSRGKIGCGAGRSHRVAGPEGLRRGRRPIRYRTRSPFLDTQRRGLDLDAVVEALADFGFDQSTLFRCLNEIADAGLASRLDLGDQTRRFELRRTSGGVEVTHPHFMCIDCGELTCMKDFSVQITPSRGPRRNKLGTISEILIRGHCGNCKSR